MKMLKLKGPFSDCMFSVKFLILVLLSLTVVAQALGVIYSKQAQRKLHSKLQANYTLSDKLHTQWSQLLLEQGTWQADARVEKIAREKLGMIAPEKTEVIVP